MAGSINPGDRMLSIYSMANLTPTEKNVAAVLAYCDGPGGCKPSLDWLGEKLGMNRYTVSAHLNSIKEKGRITWKRGKSTNIYTIFYPVLTVGDSLTVKENLTVGDSPNLTVGDSPTQRESIREDLPPVVPPGGQRRRKGKQGTLDITAETVARLRGKYGKPSTQDITEEGIIGFLQNNEENQP